MPQVISFPLIVRVCVGSLCECGWEDVHLHEGAYVCSCGSEFGWVTWSNFCVHTQTHTHSHTHTHTHTEGKKASTSSLVRLQSQRSSHSPNISCWGGGAETCQQRKYETTTNCFERAIPEFQVKSLRMHLHKLFTTRLVSIRR